MASSTGLEDLPIDALEHIARDLMASSTGLEDLPIDALEHIARYISANDLSSCCAVSRKWHNIFNDDIFWKKYCNTKLDDYFQNSDSCVEPKFSLPKEKTSALTDVGKYRLSYMRQQHLWRNWRSGRFKVDEIECGDRKYVIKVEFVGNNYVFLHTTLDLKVWNLSNPSDPVMIIPFYPKQKWGNKFPVKLIDSVVIGNKLIVVRFNNVEVFNICLVSNSWSFAFAFFIDKPEEFSASITADSDIESMFKETSLEIAKEIFWITSGEFFIGMSTKVIISHFESSYEQLVMHIWNINTGKKVKEQTCENIIELSGIPSNIGLKKSCTSSQKILVELYTDQSEDLDCFFFVYDLSQLDFSHWSRTHDNFYKILLNDPYIYIHSCNKIQIFFCDCTRKGINNNPEPMENYSVSVADGCITAFRKNLIVVTFDCDVLILNPSSRVLNLLFHLDDNNIDCFRILHDRFIVFNDAHSGIIHVWELENKPKQLFSFPVDFFDAIDDACTKIVVGNENTLTILNFW